MKTKISLFILLVPWFLLTSFTRFAAETENETSVHTFKNVTLKNTYVVKVSKPYDDFGGEEEKVIFQATLEAGEEISFSAKVGSELFVYTEQITFIPEEITPGHPNLKIYDNSFRRDVIERGRVVKYRYTATWEPVTSHLLLRNYP